MDAGTKLDALVAEKIMGYVVGNDPHFEGAGPKIVSGPHWKTLRGDRRGRDWLVPEGEGNEPTWQRENEWPITCPAYSTDPAAAWQVVEKMYNDGYRMKLEVNPAIRGVCEVSFQEAQPHPLNEWSREWSEERDAMPALICLTALKAIGIDAE